MVGRNPSGKRSDNASIDTMEAVTHLVFAGGGARAVAHIGALAALADLGHLKRVEAPTTSPYQPRVDYYLDPAKTEAVAGSSTGGFLAALLSLGVGVRTAYNIIHPGGTQGEEELLPVVLAEESLDTRYRPTFDGVKKQKIDNPHSQFWDAVTPDVNAPGLTDDLVRGLDSLVESTETTAEAKNAALAARTTALNAMGVGVGELLEEANDALGVGIPSFLIQRLLTSNNVATYIRNILFDYGAFSGRQLRAQFGSKSSPLYDTGREGWRPGMAAEKISDSEIDLVAPGDTSTSEQAFALIADLGNLTFEQYDAIVDATHQQGVGFRTSLALTGTNLSERESVVFGPETTPRVPIADAVRTTMAFPLLLKPTVVDRGPNEGLWVDGAVMNAYPLHAFDEDGELPETVLGFRLGVPTDRTVASFADLSRGVVSRFLEASTTTQVRGYQDAAQTVTLPVGDLPYLSAPKDEERVTQVLQTSAVAVYDYFGKQKPEVRATRAINQLYSDRPKMGRPQ